MKRGSKFLIVALSTIAMAGTAAAQGDGTEPAGDGTTDPAAGDGTTTDPAAGDGATDPAAGDAAAGGDTGDMGGNMDGDMSTEGGGPSLVLAKGKFAIGLSVQINLSKSLVAKPIAIQPDIAYGVMPKLDVGIYHSSMGLSGFWGGFPGGGICVTGADNGCAKAFNGPTGILAHYLLTDNGKLAIAADAGLVLRVFDPFAIGAKVGIDGHFIAGKIMVGFNPNIGIGITKRSEGGGKEQINVPVSLMFMASPKLAAGLQTGISGPLDGFGDGYVIPVSLGAMFNATPNIMAGASFNLLRVAGFEGPGAADLRSLTVFLGYHN